LSYSKRFLLQVEGGRVDHGAHASDAGAALNDMLAFDDALVACLEFQKHSPETLIVVTTDHGNSNLGLNGMGDDYERSPELFANVAKVKRSYGVMLKELALRAAPKSEANIAAGDDPRTLDFATLDASLLRDVIEESTGWPLSRRRAEHLLAYLSGRRAPLYDQFNSPSNLLGQLMANRLGIGWTGNAHTADYVPLVALGPGSGAFHGFLQNTDIFPAYLAFAGVNFRNPSLPLMDGSGPSAEAAEKNSAD
jgi:alkaline phosphatase